MMLIVDNADTITYNLVQRIGELDRTSRMEVVRNDALTLDEIENEIIRPFGDARIHFAIVCAAHSCPPLQSWAYIGDSLDVQLDRVSRAFLADTTQNEIDPANGDVRVSQIFNWYGADFERDYGSVIAFLRRYGPVPASEWDAGEDIDIQYVTYDWLLNSQGER